MNLTKFSPHRQAAGLIKMFVMMVLMAAVLLVGFSVFANWDKDANLDGSPDGFTLRLFDLSWYGIAGEAARPLAQDLRNHIISVKDKVLEPDGLLDKGEKWYKELQKQDGEVEGDNRHIVRPPESQHNKQDILHNKINKAEEAVEKNDPEHAYKFDAQSVGEKPTLHLEDDILEAGQHFSTGMANYRSAFDEKKELKPGFEEYLIKAETELRITEKMLKTSVPEYEKRSDKDVDFLANSKDVLDACSELIRVSFDNIPQK